MACVQSLQFLGFRSKVGSLVGALVGGVGALVSGVGALVGGVGALVEALVSPELLHSPQLTRQFSIMSCHSAEE